MAAPSAHLHDLFAHNLLGRKHFHSGCPLSQEGTEQKTLLKKSLITGSNVHFHSLIHSGHFYSAPSSPLLLRGALDYSTDTGSEFHAKAHRQLQVKDLPKDPTWWLERESNPRPSG